MLRSYGRLQTCHVGLLCHACCSANVPAAPDQAALLRHVSVQRAPVQLLELAPALCVAPTRLAVTQTL